MLYGLIDRIEVHQSEKINGEYVQKLDIYYKCIGTIEIPDILPIPQTDVQMDTRKGVTVSYLAPKTFQKETVSV